MEYEDYEKFTDSLTEDEKTELLAELLEDYDIVSIETIRAITGINGWSLSTLEDLLFYATGWRCLEQLLEDLQMEIEDL